MWASYKGHADVAEELLNQGASPNIQAHVSLSCSLEQNHLESTCTPTPSSYNYWCTANSLWITNCRNLNVKSWKESPECKHCYSKSLCENIYFFIIMSFQSLFVYKDKWSIKRKEERQNLLTIKISEWNLFTKRFIKPIEIPWQKSWTKEYYPIFMERDFC